MDLHCRFLWLDDRGCNAIRQTTALPTGGFTGFQPSVASSPSVNSSSALCWYPFLRRLANLGIFVALASYSRHKRNTRRKRGRKKARRANSGSRRPERGHEWDYGVKTASMVSPLISAPIQMTIDSFWQVQTILSMALTLYMWYVPAITPWLQNLTLNQGGARKFRAFTMSWYLNLRPLRLENTCPSQWKDCRPDLLFNSDLRLYCHYPSRVLDIISKAETEIQEKGFSISPAIFGTYNTCAFDFTLDTIVWL